MTFKDSFQLWGFYEIMIITKIFLSSSKQAPPPRIEHNAANTWLQSGLTSLSLPPEWGGGNLWFHFLGLSVDKWTQRVAVVWDWEGYVCGVGLRGLCTWRWSEAVLENTVTSVLPWGASSMQKHSEWPLPSTTRKPNAKQRCLWLEAGVPMSWSKAHKLLDLPVKHFDMLHTKMWMVPYVRLQAHFMVEKPCFPCISESGESSAAERFAALCQSWVSSIPTWSMHSLLCFFKSSHQDCPSLLFSIIHVVSLLWRNHKIETLKTYSSGLLLKRDSGTYCATLVSTPCPVFCNVWVLTTSPAICAGSLCLLGFCLETSTAIAHCPKTQSLSVMWFTFPPFSF